LLTYFFLEQLLANVCKVAILLFGIDGFEERASVYDILALSSIYLLLSDSYGKEHGIEIIVDSMP
jgi:hypothetical protein